MMRWLFHAATAAFCVALAALWLMAVRAPRDAPPDTPASAPGAVRTMPAPAVPPDPAAAAARVDAPAPAGAQTPAAAAPAPAAAPRPALTLAEVARHAAAEDCWMAIDGQVYDFTAYLPQHPTRLAVIAASCGTDATEAYRTKNAGRPHSAYADGLLGEYRLGPLVR